MNSHDPAIDSAGRLGEFLDNSITELKGGQTADKLPPVSLPSLPTTAPIKPRGPNKFAELADLIARSKKKHYARADKMMERVVDANRRIESKFDEREEQWAEHEIGIDSLDEIEEGLGHNSQNSDE